MHTKKRRSQGMYRLRDSRNSSSFSSRAGCKLLLKSPSSNRSGLKDMSNEAVNGPQSTLLATRLGDGGFEASFEASFEMSFEMFSNFTIKLSL